MEIDPIIKQAIEIGIKLGIEAYRNERNANLKNKKILICRSDAERRFGRGVIRNLEKRKLVFPYQFGIETMGSDSTTIRIHSFGLSCKHHSRCCSTYTHKCPCP